MANILLGVTGSVAAIHTPLLFDALCRARHQARIVATRSATYFFDPATIVPIDGKRNPDAVVLDEDEWPGAGYQRGDRVVHIELRRWADLFLLAPLDANTLAKLACGLSDNCLTCVWRAWDRSRPVVLAPAMNTLMWENPLTARHLKQLALDWGGVDPPDAKESALVEWINHQALKLKVIPPISKRLACDDFGVGAMAERVEVLAAVATALGTASDID